MTNSGLSRHVGNIWNMMCRANCKDGLLSEACAKSFSLDDLSSEVVEEMEGDRYPKYPNYYKEYGKAIAIVRTTCKIPIDGIAGLKAEDVQGIEAGDLYPAFDSLSCYAKSLGLTLDDFLEKVATTVDVSKAMEAIA